MLCLGRHFREGGPKGRIVEQWIVAEPTVPTRLGQDQPLDHAYGRRLATFRQTERDHATVPRGATREGNAPKRTQHLATPIRVVESLASVTSRENSWSALERVDLDTRVV